MEDKYTICPKCGFEKFWYKIINKEEINLCSLCGYWNYYSKDKTDIQDDNPVVVQD